MNTIFIGIAGGTGSGKTTLTEHLAARFGSDISVVHHDNYYKRQDRPFAERCLQNYDHPDAFDTDLMIEDLKALKRGETIHCPVYDYAIHNRTDETVCQLVLRKPAVHINIDVDVEELVQDKRGAATYGQIKDYVLEHSGLKVSSLYIAQVKQKYGIIERENYNKTKSENVKQPQCPPEKEKAITEALKHFGMI